MDSNPPCGAPARDERPDPGARPGCFPAPRSTCADPDGSEGVSESTAQFFELRQIEAEGQLRDLEGLLVQSKELERQRAELWRQAAHDLRGNVGVVMTASAGLTLEGLPEPMWSRFVQSLQKSVSAPQSMLDEVTALAACKQAGSCGRSAPSMRPR